MIKSGGEWISSVELENLLLDHPDVAEAAVIAIPDPRWQERPLAIVVAEAGSGLAERTDELREHLSRHLPKWSLPDRYAFVDALPRTGVGKIDKRHLRAHVDELDRGEDAGSEGKGEPS